MLTSQRSTGPQAIEKWEFQNVETFLVEREGLPVGKVQNLEREYQRYMTIVAENRDSKLPISPPVDEFWHAHILFSRDYALFSYSACGNFIYHQPAVTEEERLQLAPAYLNFLDLYEKRFGYPSEEFWPRDCICSSCTGSWDPGIDMELEKLAREHRVAN